MSVKEEIEKILKLHSFVIDYHLSEIKTISKWKLHLRLWIKIDQMNAYNVMEKIMDGLTLEDQIRKTIQTKLASTLPAQ